MNLKRLFEITYAATIVLILFLGVLAFLMLRNHQEEVKCEKKRYKSFDIANELAQSSDDLTRYCRTYVSTGDSVWENRFWEILDIRNGVKPRPDGRKISLQDSMKKLGITEDEFVLLEEAERNSNDLVWTEKVAFNAMKGFFADEDSNFTVAGEPDKVLAQRIMFDEKYHKDKYSIMNPIRIFGEKVNERMTEDLRHHERISNLLIRIIIGVIIAIIIASTVAFVILKEKIIKEKEELEKAYKNLEESEDRYKALFENSPDGYLTIIDGKFRTCNKSVLKMMLSDETYILGKIPEEISPEYQPDGQTSADAKIEKIKKTVKYGTHTFEWVHRRYDGTDIIVEVSLNGIMLNRRPALLATWRDITDRKRIEQELRESEKSLKIAQTIGNMGSWEIELASLKFIGSEQAGQIYGIAATNDHELPFDVALEAPLPEYRDMINEKLQKLMETGEDYNVEFRLKRFDNGKIVWVHSKAELDYDEQGKPYKVIGIVHDINDRKNAEEALRQSEANLRELNATKDKFFSIISHDLKGPYSALLHLTQILVEEYDELSAEEKKGFIGSIDEIAGNSYKLLENLLEWSRMQTGQLRFNPEKLNIISTLYPSLKVLEGTAKNKNIEFNYDIDTSSEIYADKYMLDTVVRNLVSNAIKFTGSGGNITLSIIKTDNRYKFSIKDNGVGMNKTIQEKLFKIEKSVTTKGTADEKGTGLGLILCKEMVETHSGKIWVESEEGKGTTFTFTIPV